MTLEIKIINLVSKRFQWAWQYAWIDKPISTGMLNKKKIVSPLKRPIGRRNESVHCLFLSSVSKKNEKNSLIYC